MAEVSLAPLAVKPHGVLHAGLGIVQLTKLKGLFYILSLLIYKGTTGASF
jgi:hypothetical protein